MEYSFFIDEKVATFAAHMHAFSEDGYAYLYDQEGALLICVKNWDWVVLNERAPEVT